MRDSTEVDRAGEALRRGGLLALPTDTLYALAADATDSTAVRRVYSLKVRDAGKPLPLLVHNLAQAETIGSFDAAARSLAAAFWPGALTIVVPKQAAFDSLALAGSETVALRVPRHDLALAVLESAARPLTGTSANVSGGPESMTAEDVRRQLGDSVDLVLFTGPPQIGRSSTIVDCSTGRVRLLRSGVIEPEDIEKVLGESSLAEP